MINNFEPWWMRWIYRYHYVYNDNDDDYDDYVYNDDDNDDNDDDNYDEDDFVVVDDDMMVLFLFICLPAIVLFIRLLIYICLLYSIINTKVTNSSRII